MNELAARSFIMPVKVQDPPMYGAMHPVLADFLILKQTRTFSARLPSLFAQSEDDTGAVFKAFRAVMSDEALKDPNQRAIAAACVPHAERFHALVLVTAKSEFLQELAKGVFKLLQAEAGEFGGPLGAMRRAEAILKTIPEPRPNHLTQLAYILLKAEALGDLPADPGKLTLEICHHRNSADPTISGDLPPETIGYIEKILPTVIRTLEYRRAKLATEDANTIKTMALVAQSYCHLGRYEEALPLHKEVFEVFLSVLGPKTVNTAVAAWNYFFTSCLCEKPKTGLQDIRHSVEWFQSVTDELKDGRAKEIAGGLAAVGTDTDRLSQVELSFFRREPSEELKKLTALTPEKQSQFIHIIERQLTLRRETWGLQNYNTVLITEALAETLWFTNNQNRSIDLRKKLLETCFIELGVEHRNTIVCALNLRLAIDLSTEEHVEFPPEYSIVTVAFLRRAAETLTKDLLALQKAFLKDLQAK